MEVIYSSFDQDYDFRDDKTQQVGKGETSAEWENSA